MFDNVSFSIVSFDKLIIQYLKAGWSVEDYIEDDEKLISMIVRFMYLIFLLYSYNLVLETSKELVGKKEFFIISVSFYFMPDTLQIVSKIYNT